MKTVLATTYVLAVLLFSGFARAHSLMNLVQDKPGQKFMSPVVIYNVGLDQDRMVLHVDGRLPTPCYLDPSAVVFMDREAPNVLVVRMISTLPHLNACATKVKNFETAIDLRQLIQASELPLRANAIYLIRTEGHDFSIPVAGQDLI